MGSCPAKGGGEEEGDEGEPQMPRTDLCEPQQCGLADRIHADGHWWAAAKKRGRGRGRESETERERGRERTATTTTTTTTIPGA